MKKIIITAIMILIPLICIYYGYNYYNGPKITNSVVTLRTDDQGKPIGKTSEFTSNDTIYFSAQQNRFWIKEATVVWYKGSVNTQNRFLVEEAVQLNEAGYFTTELSVPEELEEGQYSVSIYVDGSDIIETQTEFTVKNESIELLR